mgnify:CR=1 FL=1
MTTSSLDHAALLRGLEELEEGGTNDQEQKQTEEQWAHWHFSVLLFLRLIIEAG